MEIFYHLYSSCRSLHINPHDGTVAFSTAFFIDSTHVAHTTHPTSHFGAKKSFVSSCKKFHVHIYVEAQRFCRLLLLLLQLSVEHTKKNFSIFPFSDNKKAVLHSTFYPIHMTWEMLTRRGVREEMLKCFVMFTPNCSRRRRLQKSEGKRVEHVWIEYEIGLCCSRDSGGERKYEKLFQLTVQSISWAKNIGNAWMQSVMEWGEIQYGWDVLYKAFMKTHYWVNPETNKFMDIPI